MRWYVSAGILVFVGTLAFGSYAFVAHRVAESVTDKALDTDPFLGIDEDIPPPQPVVVTPHEVTAQPKDTSALGGYSLLIADRGNNRLIEVNSDKQIIWEYDFRGLPAPGFGADDSFFTDGGKTVIVNLELYHLIEEIDYATKRVVWRYGVPGTHGSGVGYLYSPDDAYKLQNGDVTVADIKNCRIIEISPDKKVIRRLGKTRQCSSRSGHLDAPNGDTPLPNGHMLVSTILDHRLQEFDAQWNPVFSLTLPLKYPSDPQLMHDGNFLVAEYQHPGKIIEITHGGQVVWEFDGENGVTLDHPSLAIELPDGNILANDDWNHRVIVIDKATKHIIWQYGVTDKPGNGPGQLNIPDGMDIILRPAAPNTSSGSIAATSAPLSPHTVGEVTWHPDGYVGTEVHMRGYMLRRGNGYAIFSDEPTGAVSAHDLPVTGPGVDNLTIGGAYLLDGIFLNHGLFASNGNAYHLKLLNPPQAITKGN